MQLRDGTAQPVFSVTPAEDDSYTNFGSTVIRYVVFVETDCDTDLDGKPDLVKAWIKVPRSACEGDYKAPVIYEADPYSLGTIPDSGHFPYADEPIDESELAAQPAKRVPVRTASTEEAAAAAKYSDWSGYDHRNDYDFFVMHGYAVVGCAGLGTKDSDGLELCASKLELKAFQSIIEWLHGDRTAYTDKESNIAVKADWSSGRIGVIGKSYVGTLAYELATTGVAGLEAAVPVSGIASWYEYTN